MKGTKLVLILAMGIAPVGMTFAKDCNCDQHSAGASGGGTCSLTESSSYCQIKYNGTSSNTKAQQNGFDLSLMESMSYEYEVRIPINETFRFLNEISFSNISEEQFRDILINTVVLTSESRENAESILSSLEVDQSPFGSSGQVQEIYSMFLQTGCVETYVNTSEGDIRYLLIQSFSALDGNCGR